MVHFPCFPVYPITRARSGKLNDHVELARVFLSAGVPLFQVRERDASDRELLAVLLEIKELTQAYGARFLVNDRVDLALASGANGVHVGQDDLPVPVVRELMGREALIGLSTHNRQQFEEARLLDLDYIALGPAFATTTKDTGYDPLGEELIGELVLQSCHPVVAIGGVSLDNAQRLWDRKVDSVAVISDIVDHPDPGRRIREYLERRR